MLQRSVNVESRDCQVRREVVKTEDAKKRSGRPSARASERQPMLIEDAVEETTSISILNDGTWEMEFF
jgi:hypothetical protein